MEKHFQTIFKWRENDSKNNSFFNKVEVNKLEQETIYENKWINFKKINFMTANWIFINKQQRWKVALTE